MKKHIPSIILIVFLLAAFGQSNIQSLSGAWSFALDPLKIGEDEKNVLPVMDKTGKSITEGIK